MKSLVALVLAGSASVASAAVEDSSAASALAVPPALREKSIHEGDMELGGGFTLGKTNSNRASSTSLSLHPQVEYFVQDKLSIGGALQFWSYDFEYSDSESKSSGVGIGPSLTVYFLEKQSSVFYFSQNVQINFHSPEEDSYISNSGLGVKTFITPHTAFGVGLNYSKKLSGDLYYEDSTNLNGSFSIYY